MREYKAISGNGVLQRTPKTALEVCLGDNGREVEALGQSPHADGRIVSNNPPTLGAAVSPNSSTLRVGTGRGPARPLVARVPWWKRPVDLTLSLILLLALCPLGLLLALAVRLTSRGPVLFRQTRLGLQLRPFHMFKFRTMRMDADPELHRRYIRQLQAAGTSMAMEKLDAADDPRVTGLGRYLRATCLDELPQLLNVLRGEMSLVGPRPCIPYELETYKPWYYYRFECLPGMTGLWQVSGKNDLTTDQMMRLDIRYARTQRLWRDGWILLRTPGTIGQEMTAAWRRWRHRQQRRASRRSDPPPAAAAVKGNALGPLSDLT